MLPNLITSDKLLLYRMLSVKISSISNGVFVKSLNKTTAVTANMNIKRKLQIMLFFNEFNFFFIVIYKILLRF